MTVSKGYMNLNAKKWKIELCDDKKLDNGRKLRCYRTFKENIGLEDYVLLNIPWYKKKVLAMLRAGCLPLEVEKGRHHRPKPIPLEERVCKMCNCGSVEDEIHFLMGCNLYDDLREPLFMHFEDKDKAFSEMGLKDKFVFIMSSLFTVITVFKMYTRRLLFMI